MALNYDNLSALTRDKFIPILVDNIFNSNALLLKLMKNAEKLDGGKKIIIPVEYGKNTTQGFITHSNYANSATTVNSDSEIVSGAEYEWATAWQGIYMDGRDEHLNNGDSAVLSLLKAKMKNAEKSLKDLFGTSIFASGGATTAGLTSLNGLGTVVSGNYTTYDAGGLGESGHLAGIIEDLGTDTTVMHAPGNSDEAIVGYSRKLGGIDTGTNGSPAYKWWNSPILSFSTFAGDSAGTINNANVATFDDCVKTNEGVSNIAKKMTRMYGALTVDADSPDMIVTTQTIFDAYESSLQANKRFEGDASLADAGFQTLKFKGATIVVDSHCPEGQMYFLNTKYLDFKVHSKRNFAFEAFKRQEGYDVMQARIFWMGQLTCSNARMQGCIVGGPTGY